MNLSRHDNKITVLKLSESEEFSESISFDNDQQLTLIRLDQQESSGANLPIFSPLALSSCEFNRPVIYHEFKSPYIPRFGVCGKFRLLLGRTSLNRRSNARPAFHEINQLIIDRRRSFPVLGFPSSSGSRQPSVPLLILRIPSSSSTSAPPRPPLILRMPSSLDPMDALLLP
jgi:hypothetical protein